MAEYTPNFNLSMPEQTDTQESFIEAYRENMGIIDDNLGGGGGNADVVHLTKAEYDALPDTKLSDDKIYMLIDVPTDEETLVYPICYSTLEREVGCWIDGKPLYQRTFDIGSTTISYNSWTVSSIPKGDMETITLASAVNQNGKAFWGDVMTSLEVDNTYVALQCGRNNATEIMRYVTLRYTKTTDTAGSGSYAPTGVPTHHYDTNEQVIGTWTNGKPCYEITLEGSGSYASNTEHIIALPLNADNVRIMSGFVDIGTDWLPVSLTLGLGSSLTNGVYCYPNKSTGIHLFSSAWTFTNYSIVIQYTKSTD